MVAIVVYLVAHDVESRESNAKDQSGDNESIVYTERFGDKESCVQPSEYNGSTDDGEQQSKDNKVWSVGLWVDEVRPWE